MNLHYKIDSDEYETYRTPICSVIQNPICSELISDKHAHQPLWIDDSAPIIASDLGNQNL